MQVQRIQNNNYNTTFNGRIKDSKEMRKAIKYAINSDEHVSRQFFNTLKKIKKDGTDRVLRIKRGYDKKYGETFNVLYGEEKIVGGHSPLGWVETIINIGRLHFEPNELERPTKDVTIAKNLLEKVKKAEAELYETFI